MSLMVLCPSRGRPDRARDMLESFYSTRGSVETDIVFVLHESDPAFADYDLDARIVTYPDGTTLSTKLNQAAAQFAPWSEYIQFAADDMLYRTPAWDVHMTRALAERHGAFGYANSLTPVDLANHVVADSSVVLALGWFALPTSQHLFIDNAWTTLGKATKSLYYFPDIVIEHRHPAFGTAEPDDSYRETNSAARYSQDRIAFETWLRNGFDHDVEAVLEALA